MPSLFALPLASSSYGQATPQQIAALNAAMQMPAPQYRPLPPIQWGKPINVTPLPPAPVYSTQGPVAPIAPIPLLSGTPLPGNKFSWVLPNPLTNFKPPVLTMPNYGAKTATSTPTTK